VRAFPIAQAIGAIKLRSIDAGASFRKQTIGERAAKAKAATEFERSRAQLLGSADGVREAAESVRALMGEIAARVDEAKTSLDALGIRFGTTDTWCGLKTDTVATQCAYRNQIVNTLSEARLVVRDIRGGMLLPGEAGYYTSEPKVLEELILRPDIGRAEGWCWRDESDKLTTTAELADSFVARILTLVQADAAGELPDLW
jgi:hypothetical protein